MDLTCWVLFGIVIVLSVINILLNKPVNRAMRLDGEMIQEMVTILRPTLQDLTRTHPELEEALELALEECDALEKRSHLLLKMVNLSTYSFLRRGKGSSP